MSEFGHPARDSLALRVRRANGEEGRGEVSGCSRPAPQTKIDAAKFPEHTRPVPPNTPPL